LLTFSDLGLENPPEFVEKDFLRHCIQYGVYGVPVTLVFWNDKLIGRHYGEITPEEFEAIFKNYSESRGNYREGPEK